MNYKFIKFTICYVVGYFFLITGIVALFNSLYSILEYAFGYEFFVLDIIKGLMGNISKNTLFKSIPNALFIILSVIFIIYSKKIAQLIKHEYKNVSQSKINYAKYIGNLLLGTMLIVDSTYHLLNSLFILISNYFLLFLPEEALLKVISNRIIIDCPTYLLYIGCIIFGIILVIKSIKNAKKSGLDSAVRPEDERYFT